MNLINFIKKIFKFVSRTSSFIIFQYPRFLKYRILSDYEHIEGRPKIIQPTLMIGTGKIIFDQDIELGVNPSPYLYSGYIHIEARRANSIIKFGKGVLVNNNCSFISDESGIRIGDFTIIGTHCEIIDSDFHSLYSEDRLKKNFKSKEVIIGRNVFLGSNVKILKGVEIGDNSVIANGSIVTKSLPCNVIAAGTPATIVKNI